MKLVNIPEGFATFLGAIATVLAGGFVIGGAVIAWCSVQRQIRAAEKLEKKRRRNESAAVKAGFTAELCVYSRTIIEEASRWNHRASQSWDFPPTWGINDWPVFSDPNYYKANVGRIGLIKKRRTGAAVIGFYGNLLEFNQRATNARSGHPTEGDLTLTSKVIATGLQTMALNLAKALDGLTNGDKFPIPSDIYIPTLSTPQGIIASTGGTPENLQELLLRLAGPLPDFP